LNKISEHFLPFPWKILPIGQVLLGLDNFGNIVSKEVNYKLRPKCDFEIFYETVTDLEKTN